MKQPGRAVEFDELCLLELASALDNSGRWGVEDTAGTLNFLTPDVVRGAASLVRSGVHVGTARPVGLVNGTAPGRGVLHWMTKSGADNSPEGSGTATDWIGVPLHGTEYTHLDSHSHCFWNGQMYNGRSMLSVTTDRGALAGGLEPTFPGVVGRGILVDAVELNAGLPLPPGTAIEADDLDRLLAGTGVVPRSGDVLYVRTGNVMTHERDGLPGLDISCLSWLHHHQVSVLVSDAVNDVFPSPYQSMDEPIHTIGIAVMGMWFVDNAALDELAKQCRAHGRHEFFTSIAPITFRRATGSLVNPVAIF